MDPLPPLPKQPVGPKPTPSGAIDKTDLMLYSVGGSVVVGTQLYSKSYPHLAGEVFSNIIGGGKPAFGAGQLNATKGKVGFLVLPAPIGYADPVNYDLAPNWLSGINKFLELDAGLPRWVGIPESSILKTQPDTHPDVIAGNYRLEGVRQIRRVREFAVRATTDEVLDLYRFATSPEGPKYLYFPEEVIEDLQVTVRARKGIAAGNELLQAASGPGVLSIIQLPPTPPRPQVDALHMIVGELLARPNSYTTIRATLDVLGLDPNPPAAAPLSPPTNTLQQEAAKRAPELMRNLVSERADP